MGTNVAVIMPVYNAGRFLRECLDSILAQTYRDFVLVVCDDGSTDDSPRILAEYTARDARVTVLTNHENLGIPLTRNKLLSAVPPECEYLAIMDSDDVCKPDRLERQVNFLTDHPELCGVGSCLEIIDEDSRTTGFRCYPVSPEEIRFTMPDRNVIAQSSLMLRRAAFDEVGGYRPGLACCEDYDCWLRMLEKYDFANLPDPVLKYRMSPTQSKQSKLRLTLRNTLKIQADYRTRTHSWTFRARLRALAGRILLCLPPRLVLKLFERMTYRKDRA